MQERNCKVVKRRSLEFWKNAVARMKGCENVVALARELKVDKRQLYRWRARLDPGAAQQKAGEGEAGLRQEVERLKRVLAEKVLEIDFFKGALHKVEARRQGKGRTGAKASTTRSGE
jgi:transposase-like protein